MSTRYKFIILAATLISGIVIGRLTTAEKVVVKWRDAPPINEEIKQPEPVTVRVPDSIKYITVYRETRSKPTDSSDGGIPVLDSVSSGYVLGTWSEQIDTAASLAATVKDWNLERTYAGTLFRSDTLGTLNYSAKVQYNTLTSLAWDYTPKIKSITTTKTPAFRPFVTVRANTFEQMSVGGGVLFKNTGFEASYIKDFKAQKNGLGIGFIVCF